MFIFSDVMLQSTISAKGKFKKYKVIFKNSIVKVENLIQKLKKQSKRNFIQLKSMLYYY